MANARDLVNRLEKENNNKNRTTAKSLVDRLNAETNAAGKTSAAPAPSNVLASNTFLSDMQQRNLDNSIRLGQQNRLNSSLVNAAYQANASKPNNTDLSMEYKMSNYNPEVLKKLTGNDTVTQKQQNRQTANDYMNMLKEKNPDAYDYLSGGKSKKDEATNVLKGITQSMADFGNSNANKNLFWAASGLVQKATNAINDSTQSIESQTYRDLIEKYGMSEEEAAYWDRNYGTISGIIDAEAAENRRNEYYQSVSPEVLDAMKDYVRAKRLQEISYNGNILQYISQGNALTEEENKLKALGVDLKSDEFKTLYQYLSFDIGEEEEAENKQSIDNMFEKYPAAIWGANALDVVTSPMQGMAATLGTALDNATKIDKTQPSNVNGTWASMQNMSQYIQEGTNAQIEQMANKYGYDPKYGQFAYGVGSSTAKSLIGMGLGATAAEAIAPTLVSELGLTGKAAEKVGSVVSQLTTLPSFGASAYSSTLKQQLDMGMGEQQAQSYAVISGINEMLFEELSLDKAYGVYTANAAGKVAARKSIMDIFAQAGIEGSEEVFTELSNRWADAIINTDFSQHNIKVRDYVNAGYTEEQAEAMVKKEEEQQLLETFLAGAASGGITGIASTVAGKAKYRSTAQNILNDSAKTQAFVDEVKASAPEGSTAREIIDKAGDNKLSVQQVADILQSLDEVDDSEMTAEDVVTNAFIRTGETAEQARQDAQLVLDVTNADVMDEDQMQRKLSNGQQLTDDDVQRIARFNQNADKVEDAMKSNPNFENVYGDYLAGNIQAPSTIAQVAQQVAKQERAQERAEKLEQATQPIRSALENVADKITGRDKAIVVGETNSGQVGVMSFEEVTSDKAIVNTNKGKMNLNSIKLPRSAGSVIFRSAAELENTTAANYMVNDYSGQDIQAYVSLSRLAFNIGQNGQPFSALLNDKRAFVQMSLDEMQKTDTYNEHLLRMYNAGHETMQERKQAKVDAEKANANKGVKAAKNDEAIEIMQLFHDAFGTNIEATYGETGYNGKWLANTATIKVNSASNVYTTLWHENSEFVKSLAPEDYENMKQAVMDFLTKTIGSVELQKRIENKRSVYRNAGRNDSRFKSEANKTYSEAADEFVNDFIAGAFSTPEGMKQFVDSVANENSYTETQKQSIFQTLADWIDHLLQSISNLLSGKKVTSDTNLAMELEAMGHDLTEIRDYVLKAGKVAKTNLANQLMQDVTAEDNTKAEEFMGGELYSEQAIEDASDADYSLSHEDDFIKAAIKENGRNDDKRKNASIDPFVLDRAKAVRNITRNELEKLKPYLPEDIMGNIVVKNSSYSRSVENSLICVRSLVSGYFADMVSERVGHPLSIEQQIITSQILAGLTDDQTECTYCYVKNDRMTYRAMFNSYYEQYENLLNKVTANKDAYRESLNQGKKTEDNINENPMYADYLAGRKPTNPMWDRYTHIVNEGLSDQKSLNISDLTTAEKRGTFKGKRGAQAWLVRDAEKYAKSAAWPKLTARNVKVNGTNRSLEYIAYNGNILKWDQSVIDALNSEFGLRMYSDSDYVPAFLLENMQVVTDAAVRGLKMLSYTKDCGYARVFGGTGMGINISCFGFWDEANQTVLMDGMMGADWEEAKAVRSEYNNVGTVFVATNDKCLEWALDQDWIDVVIPFHLVRTGNDIAAAYGYKNYKSQQEDKKKANWDKETNLKSIPPTVHANNKEAYLAALEANNLKPRFEEYIDNPNYMKLVNETRMSYKDMKPVQPIFDLEEVRKELARIPKEGTYGLLKGVSDRETQDRLLDTYANEAVEKINALPEKEAFSLEEPIEKTDKFIAVHNLNENELVKSIELGGFPAPSIAIIKYGMSHSNYGAISVLFGRDTVDPLVNTKNKIYPADAYTPVIQGVEYEINQDKFNDFYSSLNAYKGAFSEELNGFTGNYAYTSDSKLSAEETVERYKSNKGLQAYYLDSIGKTVERIQKPVERKYRADKIDVYKQIADVYGEEAMENLVNWKFFKSWLDVYGEDKVLELLADTDEFKNEPKKYMNHIKAHNYIAETGEYLKSLSGEVEYKLDTEAMERNLEDAIAKVRDDYEKWLNKKVNSFYGKMGIRNGKDVFTRNGNRRGFKGTHYDWTLENIVKALYENQETQGEFASTARAEGLQSVASKPYKSIEDARNDSRERLKKIDDEEYKSIMDDASDKISKVFESIMKLNPETDHSQIDNAIADAARSTQSFKAIASALDGYDLKVNANLCKQIADLFDMASKLPTKYFEAKPERAINLDEIAKVVIPDNSSNELIKALENNNVAYDVYAYGDEDQRAELVNDEKVAFSIDEGYENVVNPVILSANDMNVNLHKVHSMDSVGTVNYHTDLEMNKNFQHNAGVLYDYISGEKWGVVNSPKIGSVNFSKSALTELLKHSKAEAVASTIDMIPYVLKYGEIVYGDIAHKQRDYNTVTMVAPVTFNGKGTLEDHVEGTYYCAVTVSRKYSGDTRSQKLHVTDVLTIKKEVSEMAPTKLMAATDARPLSLRDILEYVAMDVNIPQRFFNTPFNDEKMSYSLDEDYFAQAVNEVIDLENSVTKTEAQYAERITKFADFKTDMTKKIATRVANNLKKTFGSDVNTKSLADKIHNAFGYLRQTGKLGAADLDAVRNIVGAAVVDGIKHDFSNEQEYDKFVSGLKTWDIALSEGQLQEVRNTFDSYSGFKTFMAGKMSLDNKRGTLLDTIWTEICDLSNGKLSYGENPNNQPIALAEYINAMEPKARILDEQSYEDVTLNVALEMFREYFVETAKKDAALDIRDEVIKRNKELSAHYQKRYNDLLKEVEAAKAIELERLYKEYENLTIEQQQAINEGFDGLETVQIQQLKEDYKQRIQKLKEQDAEKLAKVKADYKNKQLKDRENKAWIEAKHKLVKEVTALQNMLAHPKEAATKHVPVQLVNATIDLLNALQMDNGRNKAVTERLAKLAETYAALKSNVKNDDGVNYGFDYDERIAADIEEIKQIFAGGKFYTDLYTPEIERIIEIVQALKTQIKNANNLIINGQIEDARRVADGAMQEVRGSRLTSDDKARKVADLIGKYSRPHLNAYREFRKLGGYTDGEMMKLYDDLENGSLKEMQVQQELGNIFSDVLEGSKNQAEVKKFISTKEKDLVEIGITDENGKPVKVSRAMRMSIIMHSFNEGNMRHIIFGGMTVPDMSMYKSNKNDAYDSKGKIYRFLDYQKYLEAVANKDRAAQNKMLTEARTKINSLVNDLSDWELKFLEAAKTMFHEKTGEYINDTSVTLKGYTIARVKKYFPINTNKRFVPTDFAGLIMNGTIEGMGMLKERVQSSKPIMLEDITDVIQRSIKNTAKYAAYAIPVRNINMAMKQTFRDSRGEMTTLENVIAGTWGTGDVKYLQNLLTDIQQGRSKNDSEFDRFVSKLRGNYAGAVLSVNPSVAIKQAASYPTAAAVLGYKPLMSAIKDMPKGFVMQKGLEELEKRNPLLWYRNQGYATQDLADAKNEGFAKNLPLWMQKAIGWTQFMDSGTVRTLEYASMHYVDDNFKALQKGSNAYWNKVSEVFTQVVTETQPNYDTLHKADIIRNPSQVLKLFIMFKTQPMQNFGILYDALGERNANKARYKADKSSTNLAKLKDSRMKLFNAVTSQLMSAVTFSAMSVLARLLLHKVGRYRDDDDKWSWWSVLAEFGEGVISAFAGMLLGGAEIYELAMHYYKKNKGETDYYSGIEVSTVEAVNDFINNTEYLWTNVTKLWEAKTTEERDNASQKIAKYSVKLGTSAGQILGIPAGNIWNIIQASILYTTDAYNSISGGKLQVSSKTDLTSDKIDTQYQMIYDALMEGDMDKYNKLVDEYVEYGKTEDNIASQLKKRIKEAYLGNEVDNDEAIEGLINSGIDDAEAGHTVAQWETGTSGIYGAAKTYIHNAADDPSAENRKKVVAEIENILGIGKDKEAIAKELKKEFKSEYNSGGDVTNLNSVLRQALTAAGYTDSEAADILKKWLN